MSYGEVVSAAAAAAAPFAAGYLAADPVYSIIRQFIGTSAGSTVAIDNKIEQAMDLVKSHLMFAVREEVDVLKEKITELLDRIAQLEYENGILRAGASPETLSLLAQSAQQAVPVSQPQLPQPQQTIAAVAAAVAQPVVIPPQPVVVPPQQQQQQQAPVASVQPVPMQPAPVQPQIPQLVTVVQQPQQLTHQQPQPQPSQPVQLQHQPQLPQQQQQQQKQPLQQPPPT